MIMTSNYSHGNYSSPLRAAGAPGAWTGGAGAHAEDDGMGE